MAFYYVKKGGTAGNTNAGRTTTPRTGAWSGSTGDYYDNIIQVFGIGAGSGTPPAAGDKIRVADNHSHTISSSTYGSGSEAAVTIESVDVTAQDQYKAGAVESYTGNLTINLPGTSFFGVSVRCTVTLSFSSALNFYQATFSNTIQPRLLAVQNVNFIDCVFSSVGSDFRVSLGTLSVIGGSISGAATYLLGLSTGDIVGRIEHCDLSGLTSMTHLLNASNVSNPESVLRFRHCKLPSLTGYVANDFNLNGYTVEVTNCGQTSAEQEYQWFFKDWAGETEHNTSNYRNESTAWEISGSKTSLVTDTLTQAVADIGRVHSFEFPTRWAELSDTDKDTLTLYLSCDDTLTDTEVWAEVYYPDGTNRHQPNSVSSRNADILAAGTELTADGDSTWTGGGSNKYKIVIPTSGDPGGDCFPTIRVNVATQSVIYWCHTIGLS